MLDRVDKLVPDEIYPGHDVVRYTEGEDGIVVTFANGKESACCAKSH